MHIPIADYATGVEVANELVSTAPDVRGREALADPSALAGLLPPLGFRTPDADDLDKVRLLRREVRAVMETGTEEGAVASAELLAGHAGLAPVLRRDPSGRWQWYVPTVRDASLVGELAAVIGVALLGLVRALGHERFRPCAAPGCGGVFADASRAGRRRYCMPGLCGNRLNVANHRARRRAVTK
ncbi:CGNR zinc finger domain-containing protein [Spirillospora sp. CA-142024]|uniref:CGNR zinc finger domain-containing protein n=1 Tax=Spirillospora sp. CA-142024 TaxID=3240036 RepID=UPI003D8A953D